MFSSRIAPRNQKNVFAITADHSTASCRIRPISSNNSFAQFHVNSRFRSAAGTRVIPKLVSNPISESAAKKIPDHSCRPRNVCARNPPASVPPIAASSVHNSITPFPQLSLLVGSSSGISPYFDGPKIAPCVHTKNSATAARSSRFCHSAYVTNPIVTTSKTFVQIVTLRLLNRSAKYPPGIENTRKGTANTIGTTSTNKKSRCSRETPDSSTRKLTSHFSALSLNAP